VHGAVVGKSIANIPASGGCAWANGGAVAAAVQVAAAVASGDAMFGTVDSWLIYCLTGGVDGGVHVTDGEHQQRTAAAQWSEHNLVIAKFKPHRAFDGRSCC
jgi:hypothetical protein